MHPGFHAAGVLFAGLLIVFGSANLEAQTPLRVLKAPAVVSAQATYYATKTAALKTYTQALDAALKSAMGAGNLAEANAINEVKSAMETGGALPPVAFVTAAAVGARTVYESTMAKARAQYLTALQANQKAILASGDLTEANKIQEEINEVTGTAPNVPRKDPAGGLVLESAEIVVTGTGFVSAVLEDNGTAWRNRAYLWQHVPIAFKGWKYTQTAGGSPPEIKVRAKNNTTVYVMTDTNEANTKLNGWSRSRETFTTSGNKAKIQVFSKNLTAGQEVKVPQSNWSGTMVLVPNK
jgi:hypothetical protein